MFWNLGSSSAFIFLSPVSVFVQQQPSRGVYMGEWRAAFLLSLSPPASQPEPKLTSRLHFQQVPPFITRQGCWRGWVREYGRGPVTGQCVPLSPLLFFSTGCWEYRPLPQTAATLLSYNLYNGALNLFGGETCSLLLLPCSFTLVSCPLLFFFLSVSPFSRFSSLIPHPSATVPLLSPLGHHSSYFVPPVLVPMSGLPW